MPRLFTFPNLILQISLVYTVFKIVEIQRFNDFTILGKCHQMGSSRKVSCQLFGRHDPQGLEYGPRELLARLASPLERNLHH
jgi:hypothetical protein